jgi:hypothetical protein
MIMNVYGHVALDDRRAALDRLNGLARAGRNADLPIRALARRGGHDRARP